VFVGRSFSTAGSEAFRWTSGSGIVGLGDLPGANFKEVLYLVNVSPEVQSLLLPSQAGKRWVLHPVQRAASAADKRAQQATATDQGIFSVPARTAVVWVVE